MFIDISICKVELIIKLLKLKYKKSLCNCKKRVSIDGNIIIHYPNNIYIGHGTYINGECFIASEFAKIKMGNECMMGAGSVVTKTIELYGGYAGIPARRIKDINRGNEI